MGAVRSDLSFCVISHVQSHMNLSGKLGQLCIAHLVLGCLPETIKVWPHAVVEATPSGRPVSVVLAQEASHQTHHH